MTIRLLTFAQQELDDAVTWYDRQAEGLGREFLDEFDRTVRRIHSFPEAYGETAPGIRRGLVARLPYGGSTVSMARQSLSLRWLISIADRTIGSNDLNVLAS